jgi:carbamoyltransferase
VTILGLNAYAHDAGVALVRDGHVVSVLEEERLNRVRKTTAFPLEGLRHLREREGLSLREVAAVAFPWRGTRFMSTVGRLVLRRFPQALNLLRAEASPQMNFPTATRFFRAGADLANAFGTRERPRVHYLSHHLSHAANAFYLSPFERAAILIMDGFGDDCSTSWYRGTGTTLEFVGKNRFFDSLGIVYSMLTKYLGYRTILDEGTVMGLASHGTDELCDEFRHLIRLEANGGYHIEERFFGYHRYGELQPVSREFVHRFGPPRRPGEPVTQRHMDVARALQSVTEETIVHVARSLRASTGELNLCFGGGVALNCLANTRLLSETGFERVFVSPNPNDAGAALGAALYTHHQLDRFADRADLGSPFTGTEFTDDEIAAALRVAGQPTDTCADVATFAADAIADGCIVGWFQGRGEMGPRALGHRSIIGDPRDPFLHAALNERVKHREFFRPYALAVLADRVGEVFARGAPSPYMSFAVPVRSARRHEIPAVLARDGTARIQTVARDGDPLFARLIDQFYARTGLPLVLNTSFNAREPMVGTPADAVRTFLNTGIDVLVIGRFVVRKPDLARAPSSERKRSSERGAA